MSTPVCMRPQRRDPVPRGVNLARDQAVLLDDLLRVVERVEEVAEALGGEDDGERVLLVGLVDRDEALVQPLQRDPVLAPEEAEAVGLQLEERIQAVEADLPELQLPYERGQPERDVAHLPLE